MRRGEVWLAGFDPTVGTEATKTRPCVVVSADESNRVVERLGRGVVTVVPLTTNTAHIHPFQVLVPATEANGLSADSKAQAEQLRALDQSRFARCLGALTADLQSAVDEALMIHLAIRR